MTQGLNEATKDAWGRVHKLIWIPVREGRSLKKKPLTVSLRTIFQAFISPQ